MRNGFEYVSEILSSYFGKRGAKIVICLVLMAYGLKNKEIRDDLGLSYDSLRKYREMLDSQSVETLFVRGGKRMQSELEPYTDKIMSDFESNPPKTLRDAQERIQKLTGIERSLHRIRVFLLKRGFAIGR